jgi:AmiR/NasT family two-component response regulator
LDVGTKARALIVDAEPVSRTRIRTALGAQVEVVAEVRDAADGVPFVAAEAVDLIVMSLGEAEGAETAQELLELDPSLLLVLLNRREAAGSTAPAARGPSELRELLKVLLGLGSLPSRTERQCRAAVPRVAPAR